MEIRLSVAFNSMADLEAMLDELDQRGALLIPQPDPPDTLKQFEQVMVSVLFGETTQEISADVIQVIPGLGVVVRPQRPEVLQALLVEDSEINPGELEDREDSEINPGELEEGVGEDWEDPEDSEINPGELEDPEDSEINPGELEEGELEDPEDSEINPGEEEADEPVKVSGPVVPQGMSLAKWPIEKLHAEWNELTFPQKVTVARHGEVAARRMIMKKPEHKIHPFLLQNPKISASEVAAIVSKPGMDPAVVRRVAVTREWTRHASVARALICHSQTTLQQIAQLIERIPDQELRHLVRGGRVRTAVKRLILKKLEKGRRR